MLANLPEQMIKKSVFMRSKSAPMVESSKTLVRKHRFSVNKWGKILNKSVFMRTKDRKEGKWRKETREGKAEEGDEKQNFIPMFHWPGQPQSSASGVDHWPGQSELGSVRDGPFGKSASVASLAPPWPYLCPFPLSQPTTFLLLHRD